MTDLSTQHMTAADLEEAAAVLIEATYTKPVQAGEARCRQALDAIERNPSDKAALLSFILSANRLDQITIEIGAARRVLGLTGSRLTQ